MGSKKKRVVIKASRKLRERLGTNIREYRSAKGWTQEALANECKFSRVTITQIEAGLHNVTLATIERIALSLGCSEEELFKKR